MVALPSISGAGFTKLDSSAVLSSYTQDTGLGNKFSALTSNFAGVDTAAFNTSTNFPLVSGDLLSTPASGANATSFTFITAPGQVSYSQGAEIQQVSIFGANNPPLTVAGRNAGELQLSDALMEGFILGKQVQQSIDQLFQMQEVTLDTQKGFVNVPVYTVFAGSDVGSGRAYGNYVIENIEVEEELRDLTGVATRARVSVSFRQVPTYQINTGIDQAGATTGGQAIKPSQQVNQAAGQAANVAAAAKSTPAAKAASGAAGGSRSADRASTNPPPVIATDPSRRVN
jgi:hypothetical protein